MGRLDKDTTGLLLLTDDGTLLHRMTSPKKNVPKVYELEVDTDVPAGAAAAFASGELMLNGRVWVLRFIAHRVSALGLDERWLEPCVCRAPTPALRETGRVTTSMVRAAARGRAATLRFIHVQT